jgi:hypothetical protein
LGATYTTRDSPNSGTALCRVWLSVNNGTNGTTNNRSTNRTASYFLARADFIGVGLALCLVGVVTAHIDAFTIDNRFVDERAISRTCCDPKAKNQNENNPHIYLSIARFLNSIRRR